MQNHGRGNPRGPNRSIGRGSYIRRGNRLIYGSYNRLEVTSQTDEYSGNYTTDLDPSQFHRYGLHQNENVRRNRTPSTSSEPSHQRRQPPNFNKWPQNRNRGGSINHHPRNEHRPNDGQFRSRPDKRPIGFKALLNLLEKDSEQLILELSNSKRGLPEFIKSNLPDDGIVLFVKVLQKVSDSAFHEAKYKVFQTYFDDAFVSNLTKYIACLPLQDATQRHKNSYFWKDSDEFWINVIKICEDIFDSIPTFACKVLPKVLKSLSVCIPTFEIEYSRHVSDEIKENVRKLNEALQAVIQENEEKEKAEIKHKLSEENYEEEPPDDFRQISVYPSALELVGNRGFLRQNVVKGPYRDVDHYLDVQFRLLREDFVGPLRSGITSYRSESRKRLENVRVYKRVQFLNPETVNEQYCVRLKFDFTKQKKSFKYENSRRFMFGALLCFTRDDFKTFLFGKVSDRKVEDLEKGELVVGFDRNPDVSYERDYLMVECGVYFEPYYHVLNGLKLMTTDNFPMEKYIVRVETTVDPPEYLTNLESEYTIRGHKFFPLQNWPIRNFYNLNESQLAAFKAAITQEFAIIQGPPGTGKTFLGLKIAKTLLENRRAWYNHTPILVICYTNHALDQFLEGITEFTEKIMRVGGQSKNEKLKSFNLRNRSKFKRNPAVYEQREQVQTILTKIKNITENLKQINFYHSIRAFKSFEDVVPNFTKTWFYRAKRHEIIEWLLGGREDETQPADIGSSIVQNQEQLNSMKIHSDVEDGDEGGDSHNNLSDSEGIDDDLFDDIFDVVNVQCSIPLITLKSMRDEITKLQNILYQIEEKEELTNEELLEREVANFDLLKVIDSYNCLKAQLNRGKQKLYVRLPRNTNLQNPHLMKIADRWDLYFHWLNVYKERLKEKLALLNKDFRKAYIIYEQMRDIEDTTSMKEVLVIGMTTTSAARLRSSLQALKSPVVIVEEAAEVLEAHIITSLTKHCQHLILIGDHQQLKPSTADYYIERRLNLGISLFERMVINKVQCYTLNVQHRMRPEIASLIRPTIYPLLEDHPSVNQRPLIAGIDNCMFFIDHTHEEENCEGTSKKNYHEVGFIMHLARHLVLNGYKPENITILAAYLGQMFEMQKMRKKQEVLKDVRIAVLDNYQGEECDIILLSLVRSNPENKIGFLSIENRVCVALSRAKNGFYLIGNMAQLCSASELWRKIKATFEEQNAIGPELALRCQVHPENVTYVKSGEDFLPISEGGCKEKCGTPLICGHRCTSLCHVLNRDHDFYKCREKCGKRLCQADERHVCGKMCYQECGPCTYKVRRTLPCDHVVDLECHKDPDTYECHVLVPTQLPCGHSTDKPCHRDPETYPCPHPCEAQVEPCGHSCLMKCHIRRDPDHLEYLCKKRCAKYRKDCSIKTEQHLCRKLCYEECEPCTIFVKKTRTDCPHVDQVPCNVDANEIECQKPCTKILSCGHKCKSKCCEPCGKCEIKVEKKVVECGHTVKVKCCEPPTRKLCNKKCPLKLPCGHPCTTNCNQPCTTNCQVLVDCTIASSCGHEITKILCSVANDPHRDPKSLLKYCNHPCNEQLKCKHPCSGNCGECSQGRIHKRCAEKCEVPLVCDHPCEFPCREACRPCRRKCPYRCRHSACKKKCGEVCTPCMEPCPRICEHQRCTRFCGQTCDVRPCEEPCRKPLKCGHRCVGFCGDPCPPKCLVCDNEELTEVFFGTEDDEDARFVLLRDCQHVLESTGLEQWLQGNENEISFKVCPKCKTPIKTTQRYSDYVKAAMVDVAHVKLKLNGTPLENDRKKRELQKQVSTLMESHTLLRILCPRFTVVIRTFEDRLEGIRNGRRQPINKHELNAITAKLQIVEHIGKICCKNNVYARDRNEIFLPQVHFILTALEREEDYITDQEIDDIGLELNRLLRIVEFSQVKRSPNYSYHSTNNDSVKVIVNKIEKYLFGLGRFSQLIEEKVKIRLKKLSKLLASGVGISESEKREIVKAMGFSKGHWYKCPNGHPYAIGECGGAMQEAKCFCGAKIGGTSHRLREDNAVATEMDGARFGAWSEAANLGNYDPEDLD